MLCRGAPHYAPAASIQLTESYVPVIPLVHSAAAVGHVIFDVCLQREELLALAAVVALGQLLLIWLLRRQPAAAIRAAEQQPGSECSERCGRCCVT